MRLKTGSETATHMGTARQPVAPVGRAPIPGLLGLFLVGLVFSIPYFGGSAGAAKGGATDQACASFDQEHAQWNAILKRRVRDGFVDYAGLQAHEQSSLNAYVATLSSVCRPQYDGWTDNQKLAYWINAYNVHTIKLILDNYPLKSIRSIGLLPGAAFRDAFISMRWFQDDKMSLNDIEHEILRKKFVEPRIHFAIVCASKGCPALRGDAYRAKSLDAQLTQGAQRFIADASKNRFDAATRTLHLSSLFKWFKGDFEKSGKTLAKFVARFSDPQTAAALAKGPVDIAFLDYDWSLNGR